MPPKIVNISPSTNDQKPPAPESGEAPSAANNGHEISPAHTAPRRSEVIIACFIVVLLFRATKRTAIMQPLRDSCGSLAHKDLTGIADCGKRARFSARGCTHSVGL